MLHRIRAGAAPLLLDAPLGGPNSGLAAYMWSLECHHVVAVPMQGVNSDDSALESCKS